MGSKFAFEARRIRLCGRLPAAVKWNIRENLSWIFTAGRPSTDMCTAAAAADTSPWGLASRTPTPGTAPRPYVIGPPVSLPNTITMHVQAAAAAPCLRKDRGRAGCGGQRQSLRKPQ